jgi:hypothetical protein
MILERIRSLLEKSPNQKAKAIANGLGCGKTEVNQVLYANQDTFAQDPVGFGWSLTALRIDFGSNCWLTAEAFEKALTSSGSPLDSSVSRITFVIGEDCKILLEALARMLAICNQLADAGKLVSVDFQSSGSTLTYLNRIGFIDLLRSDVAILPKRPRISAAAAYGGNNDGVVELRKIDHIRPDDEIPGLLRNSFVSCAGDQYNVAAHTVISELFGNVKEHSGTQSAGFAGLQNYPRAKRHHIQTVISDSGRGIAGTLMPLLERKYPQVARKISKSALDHRVALLQEVFSAGGLSQVDDSSRGLGLKGAGTYAQKYNALISVRQQDFELRIRHVGSLIEFSHSLDLARIEGTHICFDFFLD